MSTDRELLELAAKAAGIEGTWVENSVEDDYYKLPTTGIQTTSEGRRHVWNALTSSGDALRLAVKLRLRINREINCGCDIVEVFGPEADDMSYHCATESVENDDPYAATRRAIVRAAAEIGRFMP